MKIVLDTNVMVAAFRSRSGFSRRWLEAVLRGEVALLVSIPLFFEYEEVLKRPEQLAATGLQAPLVDEFLDDFSRIVAPVAVSYLWRPQLLDPADEMVLEAAVNGRADWIITYNVRDFALAASKFHIGIGAPAPVWQKFLEERIDAEKQLRP